jgi:hypothetical protein
MTATRKTHTLRTNFRPFPGLLHHSYALKEHLIPETMVMLKTLREQGDDEVNEWLNTVVWPLVKPYWEIVHGEYVEGTMWTTRPTLLGIPSEELLPVYRELVEVLAGVIHYRTGPLWVTLLSDSLDTYTLREVTLSLASSPTGGRATLARLAHWNYELRAGVNTAPLATVSHILPNKPLALAILTSPDFMDGAFSHTLDITNGAW